VKRENRGSRGEETEKIKRGDDEEEEASRKVLR
jgi:hypothetical protein